MFSTKHFNFINKLITESKRLQVINYTYLFRLFFINYWRNLRKSECMSKQKFISSVRDLLKNPIVLGLIINFIFLFITHSWILFLALLIIMIPYFGAKNYWKKIRKRYFYILVYPLIFIAFCLGFLRPIFSYFFIHIFSINIILLL